MRHVVVVGQFVCQHPTEGIGGGKIHIRFPTSKLARETKDEEDNNSNCKTTNRAMAAATARATYFESCTKSITSFSSLSKKKRSRGLVNARSNFSSGA